MSYIASFETAKAVLGSESVTLVNKWVQARDKAEKAINAESKLRSDLAMAYKKRGVTVEQLTAPSKAKLADCPIREQKQWVEIFENTKFLVATSLFNKTEMALYLNDSPKLKQAQKDKRNALSGRVSAYMASFRNVLKNLIEGKTGKGKAPRAKLTIKEKLDRNTDQLIKTLQALTPKQVEDEIVLAKSIPQLVQYLNDFKKYYN